MDTSLPTPPDTEQLDSSHTPALPTPEPQLSLPEHSTAKSSFKPRIFVAIVGVFLVVFGVIVYAMLRKPSDDGNMWSIYTDAEAGIRFAHKSDEIVTKLPNGLYQGFRSQEDSDACVRNLDLPVAYSPACEKNVIYTLQILPTQVLQQSFLNGTVSTYSDAQQRKWKISATQRSSSYHVVAISDNIDWGINMYFSLSWFGGDPALNTQPVLQKFMDSFSVSSPTLLQQLQEVISNALANRYTNDFGKFQLILPEGWGATHSSETQFSLAPTEVIAKVESSNGSEVVSDTRSVSAARIFSASELEDLPDDPDVKMMVSPMQINGIQVKKHIRIQPNGLRQASPSESVGDVVIMYDIPLQDGTHVLRLTLFNPKYGAEFDQIVGSFQYIQ